MPLVVVTGLPTTGKTRRSEELRDFLQAQGHEVSLVNEESLYQDRNRNYASVVNEKNARGELKSAVQRLLDTKRVVIADSMNFIKGFRYELFCVAKEVGTTMCTVFCDESVATARNWNQECQHYAEEVFDDLAGRYEVPNGKNRWDSPLIICSTSRTRIDNVAGSRDTTTPFITCPMPHFHDHTVHTETPCKEIKAALFESDRLKPNKSTMVRPVSSGNLMHEVDRALKDIVMTVFKAQNDVAPMAAMVVPRTTRPVRICRRVTLPELKRIQGNFHRIVLANKQASVEMLATLFVDFLGKAVNEKIS